MAFSPSALLDLPSYPVERYAPLADRLAKLLATESDVIFVQAEAILALEATASSLGNPGIVALNIVTSHYGNYFGTWLRRGGAEVHDLAAEAGRPIAVAAVKAALAEMPNVNLVAVVHAETATGILNPLPEIAALVRERGALLVVDAVASFGGHPLAVDELGADVAIIGPQKALGGPTALSVLSVSQRAWSAIAKSKARLSPSNLALGDIRDNWLERGRLAPPGMPAAMEFWALDAALARVEAEGLAALIARHEVAARAARRALAMLGLALFVEDESQASTLMTTVVAPAPLTPAEIVARATAKGGALYEASGLLSVAPGAIGQRLLRLDHTGRRASRESVTNAATALSDALHDLGYGGGPRFAHTAAVAAIAAIDATYAGR